MVFTRSHGRMPSIQRFQPGPRFATVRFTWSQFDGGDGRDVTAIFIGQASTPGAFALVIDDLALP
jgi:hypothetical protein